MMFRTVSWIAAGAILAAACSGSGADDDSSSSETTAAAATTETAATTVASTTTISATTSTKAVTTTEAASTTSTTTEPPGEVNPPDVEAWWCGAFEAAAGQSPVDFAQGLADDFRHGYTDMPAGTLEEGAEQVALVSCDPEYGRAVAEALVQ